MTANNPPLDLDYPFPEGHGPKPAGAYRLDIGLKPVRTIDELRAILSLLQLIQRHARTLDLPNVQLNRTAIVNLSDKISLSVIDDELGCAGFREHNIIFNSIPDDEIAPV
jgi:hypothetical protein